MKLHAKVIVATWQQLVAARAFASAISVRLDAMLLKFTTNEDRQAAL